MSANASQAKALEDQVRKLQASLDDAVGTARRRKTTQLTVLLIAIVAMACYFTFAHNKIAEVDAELIALNLEGKIQQELFNNSAQFSQMLKDKAPVLMDEVEHLAMDVPKVLAVQMETNVNKIIADALPQLEKDLIEQIDGAVASAKIAIGKEGPVTEDELKTILAEIAKAYGERVKKMANDLHGTYTAIANPLMDYLSELAKGEGLDTEQTHHRNMVILLQVLLERYSVRSADENILGPN